MATAGGSPGKLEWNDFHKPVFRPRLPFVRALPKNVSRAGGKRRMQYLDNLFPDGEPAGEIERLTLGLPQPEVERRFGAV
jgi:hypothetical protein